MPHGWLARQEVVAFMFCFVEALPIAKPGSFAFLFGPKRGPVSYTTHLKSLGRAFPSK